MAKEYLTPFNPDSLGSKNCSNSITSKSYNDLIVQFYYQYSVSESSYEVALNYIFNEQKEYTSVIISQVTLNNPQYSWLKNIVVDCISSTKNISKISIGSSTYEQHCINDLLKAISDNPYITSFSTNYRNLNCLFDNDLLKKSNIKHFTIVDDNSVINIKGNHYKEEYLNKLKKALPADCTISYEIWQRPDKDCSPYAHEKLSEAEGYLSKLNLEAKKYKDAKDFKDAKFAISKYDYKKVKKILQDNNSISTKDLKDDLMKVIFTAAKKGKLEFVEYFVKLIPDVVNGYDSRGFSLLQNSIFQPKIVDVLVTNGCDVGARSKHKKEHTAKSLAEKGAIEAARILNLDIDDIDYLILYNKEYAEGSRGKRLAFRDFHKKLGTLEKSLKIIDHSEHIIFQIKKAALPVHELLFVDQPDQKEDAYWAAKLLAEKGLSHYSE